VIATRRCVRHGEDGQSDPWPAAQWTLMGSSPIARSIFLGSAALRHASRRAPCQLDEPIARRPAFVPARLPWGGALETSAPARFGGCWPRDVVACALGRYARVDVGGTLRRRRCCEHARPHQARLWRMRIVNTAGFSAN
jgi:hypothetical protein